MQRYGSAISDEQGAGGSSVVGLGQALPAGTPPHLVETAIALCADCDPDACFEFGLKLIIQGVRQLETAEAPDRFSDDPAAPCGLGLTAQTTKGRCERELAAARLADHRIFLAVRPWLDAVGGGTRCVARGRAAVGPLRESSPGFSSGHPFRRRRSWVFPKVRTMRPRRGAPVVSVVWSIQPIPSGSLTAAPRGPPSGVCR